MAIEYLTQDQIDKVILEGSEIDDVAGENDDKKNNPLSKTSSEELKKGAQETRLESLMIKKTKAARRYPERKNLIRNGSEGYRVVIIGEDKKDSRGVNKDEESLPESPLMEYALFTFDLKSGSIDDSTSSLFRSLVGRLLDTSYSELVSPTTQNILVARFNNKEGLLNGIYHVSPSKYKVHASSNGVPMYETRLVFYESADNQERFASGLESELRRHSNFFPGAIYIQKELRVPLGNHLDDLNIGITAEHDLGSFPREERRMD